MTIILRLSSSASTHLSGVKLVLVLYEQYCCSKVNTVARRADLYTLRYARISAYASNRVHRDRYLETRWFVPQFTCTVRIVNFGCQTALMKTLEIVFECSGRAALSWSNNGWGWLGLYIPGEMLKTLPYWAESHPVIMYSNIPILRFSCISYHHSSRLNEVSHSQIRVWILVLRKDQYCSGDIMMIRKADLYTPLNVWLYQNVWQIESQSVFENGNPGSWLSYKSFTVIVYLAVSSHKSDAGNVSVLSIEWYCNEDIIITRLVDLYTRQKV